MMPMPDIPDTPEMARLRAVVEQQKRREAWVQEILPVLRAALREMVAEWSDSQYTEYPYMSVPLGAPTSRAGSIPAQISHDGRVMLREKPWEIGMHRSMTRDLDIVVSCRYDGQSAAMTMGRDFLAPQRIHKQQGNYPDPMDYPDSIWLMLAFRQALIEQDTRTVATIPENRQERIVGSLVYFMVDQKYPMPQRPEDPT